MKVYDRVNVLGTWYDIISQTEAENPKLYDKDGMCESYSKKLIIDLSSRNDRDAVENEDDYFHFILRHEGFHALFHEIGHGEDYCRDEMLINMLASLYPKIRKIMDFLDKINLDENNT